MKVGIIGGGESGVGAALLAKSLGYEVFLSDYNLIDDNYKSELEANKIPFEQSGHSEDLLCTKDMVIKSPGIPQNAKILQTLKQKGVKTIGEIEFGYLNCKAKIIAITGTNGKTTTTNLTYHILSQHFNSVGIGGNIGRSFSRILTEGEYEWIVLEISSFQLEDIFTFKPSIACILNVTPDHLDRYDGSMDLYRQTKFRISTNQKEADVLFLSDRLENKKSISKIRSKVKFISPKDINIEIANPYLKGVHNALNTHFAQSMALESGVPKDIADKAINDFVNSDHRLQPIAQINEVLYVNDSKATNIDASRCALTAFGQRPIIWIVGGIDKGNNYEEIEAEVKNNVKAIIALGLNNEKIEKYFQNIGISVISHDHLDGAVSSAVEVAKPNDVVLLSPACASFDLFRDYKDRGHQFVNAVWNIIER